MPDSSVDRHKYTTSIASVSDKCALMPSSEVLRVFYIFVESIKCG